MSDNTMHKSASRAHDDTFARAVRLLRRAAEYESAGEIEAAVELYRTSLEIAPSAETHTLLARTFASCEQFHEAVAECHQAIKLDPEFGDAWNDVGTYLVELGRVEESIRYFERAIRAGRCEARHDPHFNLGRVYERLGRWYEAVDEYDQAAELLPAHPDAFLARTSLLARLN